ncbi:MAG: glycine cleavage system protein H [Lentisphaeria bacterium]|nr:glycine cleavage system protein H [Lentisphaeria bacterium]
MQECPTDLLFSHRHVWVKTVGDKSDGVIRIGLSHYFLEELSEILSLDLPHVGDELIIDHHCFHLHTADDILDIEAPVSAHVTGINHEVLDNPDLLHIDAYEHWVLELECDDFDEFEILVDATRYARHVETTGI